MQEIGYKVVWPLGNNVSQTVTLAPRISDFKNKTICELSDYGFRSEEIFPLVRKLPDDVPAGLAHQSDEMPGVAAEHEAVDPHGPQETEIIANLAEKLHQFGCDAVISGVGG